MQRHLIKIILILSFALRFIHAFQVRQSPLFGTFAMDAAYYDKFALKILSGDFLFKEMAFLNPLFPFILSFIYLICGHRMIAVLLCQAIIDTLTCLIIYLVCLKAFNKTTGLIAAFIYAACGTAIFYTGFPLDTTFSALFAVLSVLLFLRADEEFRPLNCIISGLIYGLFILLRPNALLLLPVFALWIYRRRDIGLSRRHRNALAVAAGILITTLPFMARNYMLLDGASVFGAHGGINFYIGNHEGAYGGYESAGMSNAPVEIVRESISRASAETKKALSASQASFYWFKKGLGFMTGHPLEYCRLTARKFFLFWNGAEIEANLNIYFCKTFLPLMRLPFFDFRLISPLGLLGIIMILRQRQRRSGLVAAFILVYMISVVAFFITSRYRFPIVPLLSMSAGYALYRITLAAFSKNINQLAGYCTALILLFIITNNCPFRVTGSRLKSLANNPAAYNNLGAFYSKKGMFDEAIAEYKKALGYDPDYKEALFNLANSYYSKGMFDNAAYEYGKVIKIDPGNYDSYYNLGVIYQRKGFMDKAEMAYENAIRVNPGYAQAYNNLGNIHSAQGLMEKAVKDFQDALRANPNYITALDNLGVIYHNMGNWEGSCAQYRKILSINPDYAPARDKLEKLYREKAAPKEKE